MQDDKNVFKSLHRIPNIVFLISVKAIQFVGVFIATNVHFTWNCSELYEGVPLYIRWA